MTEQELDESRVGFKLADADRQDATPRRPYPGLGWRVVRRLATRGRQPANERGSAGSTPGQPWTWRGLAVVGQRIGCREVWTGRPFDGVDGPADPKARR
jgi:hypothetical protein